MTMPNPVVAQLLDQAVPQLDGRGDWEAVVREVRSRSRRRRLATSAPAAVAIAAAVLALVLAWPFSSGGGTVLERALAVADGGPVVHVVLRDGWGGTLVDLESGERRRVDPEEREVWYDPRRGVREIARFAGVVQSDVLRPSGKVAFEEREYAFLATGYGEAIRAGRARVLGRARVDGIRVFWIRVHEERNLDVADDRLHEWAHDVAVSERTYEPVAIRETLDGKVSPGGPARILQFETLPEGRGDFVPARSAPRPPRAMFMGPGETLSPRDAAHVMGERALWVGAEFRGQRLARASSTRQGVARRKNSSSGWIEVTGVRLFYGDPKDPCAGVAFPSGYCKAKGPFLSISEQPRLLMARLRWVPPEGSLLLDGDGTGFLRARGVYLTIQGPSDDWVVEAARSLEPMPG